MLLNTDYALLSLADWYGFVLVMLVCTFGVMSILYGFARFKRLNTRR